MDLESILRRRRKYLVRAAEATIEEATRKGTRMPKKAQLSRLIAVCGEASCVEEIDNYLRYQGSRDGGSWNLQSARLVIEGVQASLKTLDDDKLPDALRDRARTAMWRTYAVFLSRAFTYSDKVARRER